MFYNEEIFQNHKKKNILRIVALKKERRHVIVIFIKELGQYVCRLFTKNIAKFKYPRCYLLSGQRKNPLMKGKFG